MATVIQQFNSFLDKMTHTRSAFDLDASVPRLTRKGAGSDEMTGKELARSATFGFVPVFDTDGEVSFFVRMGGPEIIRKHRGTQLNSSMGGIETSATLGTDLASYYGEGASGFRGIYDTVVDGAEMMSYIPTLAYERDMVQTAVLNQNPHIPMSQIAWYYPFKLKLNKAESNYTLFYADDDGIYAELSDPAVLARCIEEMLNNLLFAAGQSNNTDGINAIFKVLDEPADVMSMLNSLFERMARDFKIAADIHLLSWLDDFGTNANGYDPLYYAAFLQLTNADNVESDSQAFSDLMAKVDAVADRLKTQVDGADVTQALPLAKTFFANISMGAEQSTAALKLTATKLRAEADALREENKKLASEAKNTSVHRYVGLAAGAGSAYLAVKDTDLEDWQKMAAVVAGGVFGMIPIFNYVTIAAAPLAVKYGVEFAKSRRSPVRSTSLGQDTAPLALPAPSPSTAG